MGTRSIGSATISFGLVSVPVKLFSAGDSKSAISFNMLHNKDGARLKQQYVCSKDGEIVEQADRIKGFEVTKDSYVHFTNEELKALEEHATGAIEVTQFLPVPKVDRLYVQKTYYLGPDKGGERAYALLAETLKKTGQAGLGQYAARGKQYLVMVRPLADAPGLAMEQLHYADEICSAADVPIPHVEVKKAELDLAIQLVKQTSVTEFHPEAFKDNVRERTMEQITAKAAGKTIVAPTPQMGPAMVDLMSALQASLKPAKAVKASPAKAPRRAAVR